MKRKQTRTENNINHLKNRGLDNILVIMTKKMSEIINKALSLLCHYIFFSKSQDNCVGSDKWIVNRYIINANPLSEFSRYSNDIPICTSLITSNRILTTFTPNQGSCEGSLQPLPSLTPTQLPVTMPTYHALTPLLPPAATRNHTSYHNFSKARRSPANKARASCRVTPLLVWGNASPPASKKVLSIRPFAQKFPLSVHAAQATRAAVTRCWLLHALASGVRGHVAFCLQRRRLDSACDEIVDEIQWTNAAGGSGGGACVCAAGWGDCQVYKTLQSKGRALAL